ncbi:sulfotransferase domain-containing protein [Aphanothece sacrum]|uniref:Sulfotransferase n=1 Tax=Aphanothece sacrum FPU1 TaxID=1920663 RepID=A0A401IJF4_APHSA|nr:sulfotransferase domain-containing protein [Aphanothece sacrum]GBF81428.1 sulfotransferase [Aphanothece sacrum FPU1]GBF85559.1 sulfotransferase [Aphanothece sacrum FPU3]
MRKPDFIIIGAAKSGTTTLYQYLCRHPQIYMSTPKEPDFFSLEKSYARGIDWYESLFKDATPDQICGEASTTYSRYEQHPKAAERIAKYCPNVKLIYIMRHPLDRAYSFYAYRFKGTQLNQEFHVARNELMTAKTFEEAIAQQSEFIDSSYYLEQIERYLPFFPRESFLFLLMEDLIEKPASTLNQILTFLGADSTVDIMKGGEVIANQAKDYREGVFQKKIAGSVNAIPGVKLMTKLVPKPIKQGMYNMLKDLTYEKWKKKQYFPPKMLPETRIMLIEKFREPNRELAQFLNRDLSHWDQ